MTEERNEVNKMYVTKEMTEMINKLSIPQHKKNNGIKTSYHKITSINLTTREEDNILLVVLTSYLDETYRQQLQSIETTMFDFELTEDEDINIGIRELGYKKLKEMDIYRIPMMQLK